MKVLHSDAESAISVLFLGGDEPTPESFLRLRSQGIELGLRKPREGVKWSLKLKHPEWGRADLYLFEETVLPDAHAIAFTPGLSDQDRALIAAAGLQVTIAAKAHTGNVLRDRKLAMRFARAVMGEDGIAAADHASRLMWTSAALDDELAHDADLDIESLYCIHAITREGEETPYWVHTHGLAQLKAFDLDILAPHEGFADALSEAVRAMAFAIVEGALLPDTASFQLTPWDRVRMVDAREFMRRAAPADAALRDMEEDHTDNRSVVCDPPGKLARLLGGRPRPAGLFRKPARDEIVYPFSTGASDLMAQRARRTMDIFQKLMDEFAPLGLPALVKVGYPTDGAADAGDREHLWIKVDKVRGDTVLGTLENQPYKVSRMNKGDRGEHPVELLSDWTIITPAGPIQPRGMRAARVVRENYEEIERVMREARQRGDLD